MTGIDVVMRLQSLSRTFAGPQPVHALREVNLTVRRGDYVGIVGPSGSGKSTLLNVVGLLDAPTSGSYHLEGVETRTLRDTARASLRGSRIGFVFQSFHLLAHRSALDNVMLGAVYAGSSRKDRRDRALTALHEVGVEHRADFLPTRLSGGERQRVAIARALVNDPALLLCDEPTGNLDSANTGHILELFDALRARGATLLVITHDADVSARADRSVRIVDGRLDDGAGARDAVA